MLTLLKSAAAVNLRPASLEGDNMTDYQVTCTKKDGADADRRIDKLGGPQFAPAPIDDVIRWIESGAHKFWTSVQGRSVWIEVRVHPASGRKYLTTQGDGFPPNNLLRLPDCP